MEIQKQNIIVMYFYTDGPSENLRDSLTLKDFATVFQTEGFCHGFGYKTLHRISSEAVTRTKYIYFWFDT